MPDDSLVPLDNVSLTPACDATSSDLAHDSGVGDCYSLKGRTDMSPSPVTVNQKTARKKSRKLGCQSSVQFVDLPFGSEDSELSESCDDEVEVKTQKTAY